MFEKAESDIIAIGTGCTACVALITQTELYCANIGDSRCVVSKNGTAIEMSVDHKPDLPAEKERIKRAGGFVEENRVNGILNLSRALGDLRYKENKVLSEENQLITCVPEIKVEKLTDEHDFLIIACDGIWDCVTSQECITMAKEWLSTTQEAVDGNLSTFIEQVFDDILAEDTASSGKKACISLTESIQVGKGVTI